MSDEEEENFCYFGTPLEQYDEDSFPKKKPISVEDQVATDAQGRRRFHGAFTGGFSAGFFNTVGSLEGWTPSEFKSTRQDKARNVIQKPEDFMDQEDLEEHGIAPQTIRATNDYSTSKKRKKQVFSEGPIPGVPVLDTLLTSGNETIGYLLLKKIGIKDKIKEQIELYSDTKVYGCQMPGDFKIPNKVENNQYKIPEIYIENLSKLKTNTYGLGYQGLHRNNLNLFSHSNLTVTDKNDKMVSIGGQAFGVGAFEEEDDDIYSKEDMSNYDFELGNEKQTSAVMKKEGSLRFGMFKSSRVPLIFRNVYLPPKIPHSFTGKHKNRKSRFGPIEVKVEDDKFHKSTTNPAIRAACLGEDTVIPIPSQLNIEQRSSQQEKLPSRMFDVSSLMTDRFVSASRSEDLGNLEPVVKIETEHGTRDMREAAKMNMYGPLTRITSDWTPCALLCKRFNVPEPIIDHPEQKQKKRTKNLIFENSKHKEIDNCGFKPGCSTTSNDVEETTTSSNNNSDNKEQTVIKSEVILPVEETEIILDKTDAESEKQEASQYTTEKIGIEDKIDLFKAVFLNSSESEDEEKEKEPENKTENYKETILSDFGLKIKPLKSGILSNINFQPINTIKEECTDKDDDSSNRKTILYIPKKGRSTNKDETQSSTSSLSGQKSVDNIEDDKNDNRSYGPQLPSQKIVYFDKNDFKANIVNSDDEWVEKDDKTEKKSRHKKKSKKKKHKHSKKDR